MTETERKKPSWRSLIILEGVTLGAGALVGFLTQKSSGFYETLTKPAFAPPGWVFPVAWSILYAAMALAMWFVWRAQGQDRGILLGLYAAQLAVNLVWPFLFFVQQALGLAFFWLILLWMLVGIMMWQFFKESSTAGWLILPYLAWTTFATVLNFMIARLNP
ncbi:MAG: tryptophan-rich sensory protein [Clostridia bacterium]|nr:tryptophan-rich sensory protein [Clostridia bacterium]